MWQMNLNFGWLRLFFGYRDGDPFSLFHGAFLPVWVGGGQPMASCRAK